MSEPVFYLGVDGGGTKTDFVCTDAGGDVVGRVTRGTSYHLQVGLDEAVAVLSEGIGAVCTRLGVTPGSFRYAFFGLPAYGEDDVVDPQLAKACRRLIGHDRMACGNDMISGWAGSLGCADGINLVAGTGSIGYGERKGLTARSGGWGEMFGDEGSAYWIAIRGLNAFTRMSDGRLPVGLLHEVFRQALGLSGDLEVCARVMGDRGMSRDEIAALCMVVSQAAACGDAAALQILDEAADELAAMAEALRRALEFGANEAALLSWSGGVLTREQLVRDRLRERLPNGRFTVIEPRHDPGHGAALYAAHLDRRVSAK